MRDANQKINDQIQKAGLPTEGTHPFLPKFVKNRTGDDIIDKRIVKKGPKRGKKGSVDRQGRIWIRDRAHANLPDHWDVQSTMARIISKSMTRASG